MKRSIIKIHPLTILLVLSFGISSCLSDVKVPTSQVGIATSHTNDLPEFSLTSGTYTFQNINTGVESTADLSTASTNLLDGIYNVTFIGKGQYTSDGQVIKVNVQGVSQNVKITGDNSLTIPVYVQNASNNFVISEVFATGTLTTADKQYNGDQYLKITNNSDKTLYADGLAIVESKFLTTTKFDYTPNIMNDALAVQVVAKIPGNGTDYPVEPGKSIIVCDNAINHKEANTNSVDLSGANFEWYTHSTTTSVPDVDNPNVPNLDMVYNYTKTIWVLSKQGNKAYALCRFPEGVTDDSYLTDYIYKYTYTLSTGGTSKEQTTYQIPNSWILDAVNIGPNNGYVWNVTAQSLDLGHTYFGDNITIAENVGKSVIRKVAYTTSDGREVLQDTNNSSVDFIPSTTASLILIK